MRPSRIFMIGLAVLAIVAAVRWRSSQAGAGPDTTAVVNLQTAVPASVMSTLRRACFDCHSDQTRWPWYASIPGARWVIERDVKQGRSQLDFSRWAEYEPMDRADILNRVCKVATDRTMPPWQYRLLHAEARLSVAEVAEFCVWTRHEAARLVPGGS